MCWIKCAGPPCKGEGAPKFATNVTILFIGVKESATKASTLTGCTSPPANKKLYLLRRLKRFGVSVPDLKTVYTSYSLPPLLTVGPISAPSSPSHYSDLTSETGFPLLENT
ncbi:hypothetical protein Bbelb_219810 [Branchiostoma belcheri]|nr:hypothetical protein Bbelb_219810 [Branchiostoma belcheri]